MEEKVDPIEEGNDDDENDNFFVEKEVEEGDNIARLRTKVMEIQRREFDPAQYNFEIELIKPILEWIKSFSYLSVFVLVKIPQIRLDKRFLQSNCPILLFINSGVSSLIIGTKKLFPK